MNGNALFKYQFQNTLDGATIQLDPTIIGT
mgnify:FL=1